MKKQIKRHIRTVDLEGQVFGKLAVVEFAGYAVQKNGTNQAQWMCRCECGNYKIVRASYLKNGDTTSCGCLKAEAAKERTVDLEGQVFGKLTVAEFAGYKKLKNGWNEAQWLCKCSCGNTKIIQASSLKRKNTNSCGNCHYISIGDKFSKLTVKEFVGYKTLKNGQKKAQWCCQCKCGNEIVVKDNALKSGNTKSCGCLKNPKGEKHPRWNSDLTDEEREKNRDTLNDILFRNAIYERDNHTCQCCGKRGGTLNAHHMANWADNPELRYDTDNGITLCEKCHKAFHKIYTYFHTTAIQTEAFLTNK